jgi:uncharacterized phage infection (PIP) family protein YhgE
MNTPSHDPADVVTGIMLQITQQAEQLALLDQREASNCRHMTNRLDELVQQLAETREQVDAIHDLAARQAALLETLNGLDQQVSALATRLTQMTTAGSRNESGESYQPAPAPRWWKLNETERGEAINRLRAWVEQIYRPSYGHLAAALGTCWDQHPLCLYGLDWLMELWSGIYLAAERNTSTLASQAEWQMRLLPALAEQFHVETTRCEHDRLASNARKEAIQNALNRITS